MARKLRPQFPGATYHLFARGVAGLPVYHADGDRHRFLWILEEVVRSREWACHSYCLMTTHYHLIVRTPNADVALGMKRLNSLYAQGFNRRYERFGHVFAERYGAVLIESEPQLLEDARYVALNPVRAGLCRRPEEWPWSSYPAALGLVGCPAWLNARWLVSLFGPDERRARRRFADFVNAPLAGEAASRPSQIRYGV